MSLKINVIHFLLLCACSTNLNKVIHRLVKQIRKKARKNLHKIQQCSDFQKKEITEISEILEVILPKALLLRKIR